MRYFILVVFLLLIGCIRRELPAPKLCPHDIYYPGHYLRVPITISPHQLTYQVGDTIMISTVFSDSIYDLGTRQTFKIENFPFKPLSLLYRFEDGTHDSGYRVNELIIDSIYNRYYFSSSNYADGYRAYTTYKNGEYKFESKLVLKEVGTYILVMTDLYQDHSASGRPDLNDEANAITFDGKCPNLGYYICSMIDSGDDHLDQFINELIYLDEEVYRGSLISIDDSLERLKFGSIGVQFSGYFGFKVVE